MRTSGLVPPRGEITLDRFWARDSGDSGREIPDAASHKSESLLEEAFEAGLACVLGEEGEQENSSETADEADLRRILLRPLMEGGSAARMMRREVLRQAIVRTLIQDIVEHAESQTGSSTGSKSDRAVS